MPVSIIVLLFAAYRERVGAPRLALTLPSGATAADAFVAAGDLYPALRPLRDFTTFAVNREVVAPDHPLDSGDEVAFLQPVSGGIHDH